MQNLRAEARRAASMHGYTHVCARVASYARDEQRKRERKTTKRYRRAGGEGWVANVRIVVGEGLNSLYYTP